MGIQEEIFERFLQKLEADTHFPDEAIKALKELLDSGQAASQDRISSLIGSYIENDSENQKD